jgi:hypothetical protein
MFILPLDGASVSCIAKQAACQSYLTAYFLNDSPFAFKAARSFGIELGHIPCSSEISATVCFDSVFSVVIFAFSNARSAGAESVVGSPPAAFFL